MYHNNHSYIGVKIAIPMFLGDFLSLSQAISVGNFVERLLRGSRAIDAEAAGHGSLFSWEVKLGTLQYKHRKNHGKSPFFMSKATINGVSSIDM